MHQTQRSELTQNGALVVLSHSCSTVTVDNQDGLDAARSH